MEDSRALRDFIARDSPQYSEAQVRAIQAAALRLKSHPRIGRVLPEFPTENWREILCKFRIVTATTPGSRRSESSRSYIKARCSGSS